MVIPYICMSTCLFITIAFFSAHYEVFCYFLLPPLYYLYVLSKKHCTTDIMHVMRWKRSVPWLGTAFLLTELIILSDMVLYISLYSCLWLIFEQHIVRCILMYILATPAFISMFFGFMHYGLIIRASHINTTIPFQVFAQTLPAILVFTLYSNRNGY